MVTAEQIKAARVLLNWNQADLAGAAHISVPTVKRIEASRGAIRSTYATVLAIQAALENAGIQFINDNGVGVKRLFPA